jgi:2,3-bisphosphoglycerate-dependent phosphoglycerate mutase
MERLILVRHAEPEVNPAQAAAEWPLTTRGALAVRRLATVLSGLEPTWIITSPERKARETAALLAESLEIPVAEDELIAEQGAGPDEFIADYQTFRGLVQTHFAQPRDVVFRNEAAADAARRMTTCVDRCRAAGGVPVLVSHGRIMASWLADLTGQDPWEIWNSFHLPDLIEANPTARTFRSHHVPLVP